MFGVNQLLIGMDQRLLKLFTWPESGIDNLNIIVQFKPSKSDHLLSKISDIDRLTHIENKNLAATANRSCKKNQLASLFNSHEISCHLRMGYGDRPTLSYLLPKERNHASC